MTGWPILLALLPSKTMFGVDTPGPMFRPWKPSIDRLVPMSEYWSFIRAVFDMCLERLVAEPGLWPEFAARLDDLPAQYQSETLDRLARLDSLDTRTESKLWDALEALGRRHREHADADWAMSAELLESMGNVALRFKPPRAAARHAWLFTDAFLDLGGHRGYSDYTDEVNSLRKTALSEVWREGGMESVDELAHSAESPSSVGHYLAHSIDNAEPTALFQMVDSPDRVQCEVAQAFIQTKYRHDFVRLHDIANRLEGRPLAQARVFGLADDVELAWAEVHKRGGLIEATYWQEYYPYGRGSDFPHGITAAKFLAEHGRVAVALDSLAHYRGGQESMNVDLIVSSFKVLIKNGDSELHVLSSYDVEHLMQILRNSSDVTEDTISELEWALLPMMDSDPTSSTLQRRLARSPEFFMEVLSLVYRREGEDAEEATEAQQRIATNAWQLLHEWRVVPGSSVDALEVNEEFLAAWVKKSQELADASGRRVVADSQIGQILAYSRVEADGVWPPRSVTHVLEDLATEAMLRGFGIGAYNKRGITTRGLNDGGKQEFLLAKHYRDWAALAKIEFPKTARVLRQLAADYEGEGRSRDAETQRFQEGFGLGG
jgi:hypothetical protein